MTRFNDSATDTLEYVAEHGVKFTWSDFKVEQTNTDASYAWDISTNAYKWSGTPTFSYRLDIDKNVDKIVFINDGTLPNVFIMDDGVHGAIEYNANMESQGFVLNIYCNKHTHFVYINTIINHLTINNVDYKDQEVTLTIVLYEGDFNKNARVSKTLLSNTNNTSTLYIDGFDGGSYIIKIMRADYYLIDGIINVKCTNIFNDITLCGDSFIYGMV